MASEQDKEAVFDFPCDFPIKAFGPAVPEFPAKVMALVRAHAPETPDSALVCRTSRGGRYYSVTVTVNAHSRDQLDEIYRALTRCELVIMAL